jgi:tetratricopeptide (TPR) repeat protein
MKRFSIYAISLLSAVLAMKTKEIAFTLPLVVALYELMFFEGALKKRMLYLLPLLLTMLIIPLGLMGSAKPMGEVIGDVSAAARVGSDISRWEYLFTQFRVIVTYIRLLFFPVNQNLDYDYPVYRSFFDPDVFLSFLFLLSLFCLAVYLFYRSRFSYLSTLNSQLSTLSSQPSSRLAGFGIFWFFITLSVESSLIPMNDVIFEHRVYLPSVGFFIAVMAVLFMAWERLKGKAAWMGKAVTGGLIAVVFLFSGAAYARNTVWQSEFSLWQDVARKSPGKARAHNNLGLIFMNKGDMDRAVVFYGRALAIDQKIAEPHFNMGVVYERKGQLDEAIEEYRKAVALDPGYADAFFNLGVAYSSRGLRDEAIMNYKAALNAEPDYAIAHFNLGVMYLGDNLAKEAEKEFEAALSIDPSMDQARMFLEFARRRQ